MKLFPKTLVIITVILLLLVVGLNTIIHDTVGKEFRQTEEKVISEAMDRVESLVQREKTVQENQIRDFAHWTLLYDYIKDPNGSFLTGLYVNDTLYSMNLNFILLYSNNNTLVDGETLDYESRELVTVPNALLEFVNETPGTIAFSDEHDTHQLFARVGNEVAIITTSPILTTEGEGPIIGSALIGRYVDDREIDAIAELGNVNLTAEKAFDQNLTFDFFDAITAPSFNSTGRSYAVLGSDSVAMYDSIRDPDNNLLLILKVSDDRSLYNQGMAGFEYVNVFFLMAFIASGVSLLFLIRQNMLRPVTRLNDEMRRIGESGDLSARVQGSHKDDEIAQLTESFNEMLGQLESKDKGLKDSEQRYRDLVESSSDWIWQTDNEWRFIFSNTIAISILDLGQGELHQMTFFDLMQKDEREATEARLRSAGMKADSIRGVVMVMKAKDGKDVLFEMNAQPVFDDDRKWLGYRGMARNITDRVRNERALEKTNKQLNLLSSITRHDILNQTTILSGYGDLLRQNSKDPTSQQYLEKQQKALETIIGEIKLTGIYQQLGAQEPAWNKINQIFDSVTQQLDLHNLNVEIDVRPIEVRADPIIEKVFYNLIENVLRHSGAHDLRVFDEERGGHRIIVFQDNGKGVPMELKEKIFDRGFGQNTGLGLFLAREILAITHITIVENGQPGFGARFEIIVPPGSWHFAQ
jgi:PAS domain S-box-containing protein